jgi:hypothetical protein
MTATAAPPATTNGAGNFGAGGLFLADSRLAVVLLNEVRHRCLHRAFGTTREQANVLTVVLALSATSATYETTRRILRTPLTITGRDVATGTFLLREAAMGIAGPSARTTPMFGALMATALVGGLALPGLRRAAHAARVTERRVRETRIRRYMSARLAGSSA